MFFIAAIGIAVLMFTSCTSVNEKTFVGKWNVIIHEITFHDEEGWINMPYDVWYIAFYDDNTYVSSIDGSVDNNYWYYVSSTNQLRLGDEMWTVSKLGNKELELNFDSYDNSTRLILRKIN